MSKLCKGRWENVYINKLFREDGPKDFQTGQLNEVITKPWSEKLVDLGQTCRQIQVYTGY